MSRNQGSSCICKSIFCRIYVLIPKLDEIASGSCFDSLSWFCPSPPLSSTQTSPQIHTQKGPPGNDWDAPQSTAKCGQAWSPALRGRSKTCAPPGRRDSGPKSVLLWWCPGPEPPGSGSPGSRCARMRGRRALPLFVSAHSAALSGALLYTWASQASLRRRTELDRARFCCKCLCQL